MSKEHNLWIGRTPGYYLWKKPYIKIDRDGLTPLEINFTILYITFHLIVKEKCCSIGTATTRQANFFNPFNKYVWKIIEDSYKNYERKIQEYKNGHKNSSTSV